MDMKRSVCGGLLAFTMLFGCINVDNKPAAADGKAKASAEEKKLSPEEEKLAKGKEMFETACKLCHGSDGTLGLNGAKDLTKSELTKEEKINVITNGRNAMAAYKNVYSPEEIETLATYVESLKNGK